MNKDIIPGEVYGHATFTKRNQRAGVLWVKDDTVKYHYTHDGLGRWVPALRGVAAFRERYPTLLVASDGTPASKHKQCWIAHEVQEPTTPKKPYTLPCNEFIPDRHKLRDYFMNKKKKLGG